MLRRPTAGLGLTTVGYVPPAAGYGYSLPNAGVGQLLQVLAYLLQVTGYLLQVMV
jgi:hypothetical protein